MTTLGVYSYIIDKLKVMAPTNFDHLVCDTKDLFDHIKDLINYTIDLLGD
jgi:hypothetical protein